MESLELRIFKEVATVKSITKAAQNLGYVQSNVTHRIRKLETEINCELFVRSRKGVILTEEGKRLLNYANRITELLDSAMGTIKRQKKHFKVGTSETIASKKLPKLLNKVLIDEKDIDISIKIYEPKMLIDLLLNKKIDLAFINSKAITTEMLQTHFTFSENYVLISKNNYKYYDNPKLIVSSSIECPYRNILFSWYYDKYNKDPDFIEFDSLQGILESVSLGMGISIVPNSILPLNNEFKILKISDENTINISLVTNKDELDTPLNHFIRKLIINNKC